MINFFKKFIIYLGTILLLIFFYLSLFGIETKIFNNEIKKNLRTINKNLNSELNSVKIIINPLKFQVNIKTLGPKIFLKNQSIQLESIKSQIPIFSLLKKNFSSTNLSISTKSIRIKDLISFLRVYDNNVKFFLLERVIQNGFFIADIDLIFDENGLLQKNYSINGIVKDGKIDLLNKQKLEKVDFIFKYEDKKIDLKDLSFSLGKIIFLSEKISFKHKKNKYYVEGKIKNKQKVLSKENLNNLFGALNKDLEIEKIDFKSENSFSFLINEKFKVKDLKIKTKLDLYDLQKKNNYDITNFFPDIDNIIRLKDQKINIEYDSENILINGKGSLLIQKKLDQIDFRIKKNKENYSFNFNLDLTNNQFILDLLNFIKKENSKATLNIIGNLTKKEFFFDELSLVNNDNIVNLKQIHFDKNFKLKKIKSAKFDFVDIDNLQNKFLLEKKKKQYEFKGKTLNASQIIENIIKDDNKKKNNFINNDYKINFNVNKVYLDNDHFIKNLKGFLKIEKNQIAGAELNSNFENSDEQLSFTVKKIDEKKVTTFFSGKAKPLVNKYDFIKGFEEGSLDFYSISHQDVSNSKLKIYNFKLKELPALTKLLTLASLQGIADLLSGEGIRFEEFEMNYETNKDLMKINEIYAIGPAISILMDGYIEKDKLVSLRGTLVPATTINKAIGSIPILGDILVGKKTGEGVFGVSFKIKGPPKKLETTVNPIKTLTPRFITRTLEKIKKN